MSMATSQGKEDPGARSWPTARIFPKVAEIDCSKSKRWGEGTFVIPAPLEVDAAMKKVRRGKLTTIDAIRKALAKKHGTTIACPITTGIFAWIAAHAADEAENEGRERITPYWRTLKTGGELNREYPGGIKNLRPGWPPRGIASSRKASRYFVADFERTSVEPSRCCEQRSTSSSACAPFACCLRVARGASRQIARRQARAALPLRSTTP